MKSRRSPCQEEFVPFSLQGPSPRRTQHAGSAAKGAPPDVPPRPPRLSPAGQTLRTPGTGRHAALAKGPSTVTASTPTHPHAERACSLGCEAWKPPSQRTGPGSRVASCAQLRAGSRRGAKPQPLPTQPRARNPRTPGLTPPPTAR